MSIPRDTLVALPQCVQPGGSMAAAKSDAMINTAFQRGSNFDPEAKAEGMACVVRTVEEVTQIRLDAFVLVDFAGFQNVVDALGGVDICVPRGLVGRKTPTNLTPGQHHLNGQEALQYARTREGKYADGELLDGSDLGRINRQQELIAAVINEVLAAGQLTSLPKLNTTATAVADSLDVSTELGSVASLAGLAYALRDIKLENISLFTVPNTAAGYRVRLDQVGHQGAVGGIGANALFDLLATDQPVPGTPAHKAPAAAPPSQAESGGTDPDTGGSAPPPADADVATVFDAPTTC
jgi:LCP family protein required for cell wall assembly